MRGVYIILTYNGKDMPINAVKSILSVDGDVPIIVVDNGSTVQYSKFLTKQLGSMGFVVIEEDELRRGG